MPRKAVKWWWAGAHYEGTGEDPAYDASSKYETRAEAENAAKYFNKVYRGDRKYKVYREETLEYD